MTLSLNHQDSWIAPRGVSIYKKRVAAGPVSTIKKKKNSIFSFSKLLNLAFRDSIERFSKYRNMIIVGYIVYYQVHWHHGMSGVASLFCFCFFLNKYNGESIRLSNIIKQSNVNLF